VAQGAPPPAQHPREEAPQTGSCAAPAQAGALGGGRSWPWAQVCVRGHAQVEPGLFVLRGRYRGDRALGGGWLAINNVRSKHGRVAALPGGGRERAPVPGMGWPGRLGTPSPCGEQRHNWMYDATQMVIPMRGALGRAGKGGSSLEHCAAATAARRNSSTSQPPSACTAARSRGPMKRGARLPARAAPGGFPSDGASHGGPAPDRWR
jgi:hypothetical protein